MNLTSPGEFYELLRFESYQDLARFDAIPLLNLFIHFDKNNHPSNMYGNTSLTDITGITGKKQNWTEALLLKNFYFITKINNAILCVI